MWATQNVTLYASMWANLKKIKRKILLKNEKNLLLNFLIDYDNPKYLRPVIKIGIDVKV
jgi:hypothetical protein